MPGKVEQLQFTCPAKSDLGYELLAAVNAGRLRMYAGSSKEAKEFWNQVRLCRYAVTPTAAMNFFVDPRDGHDDFVTSLALAVRAASRASPEPCSVIIQPPLLYNDGRY